MTAAVRSASTKVPNLAAGTAVALTRLGARSRLMALSTVVVTTYPSSPTMAISGIATRKYIRSLMDRPRDPMAPHFQRCVRELVPAASQLTVKTARIAHNRHRPVPKEDISVDSPAHPHKRQYVRVIAGSGE